MPGNPSHGAATLVIFSTPSTQGPPITVPSMFNLVLLPFRSREGTSSGDIQRGPTTSSGMVIGWPFDSVARISTCFLLFQKTIVDPISCVSIGCKQTAVIVQSVPRSGSRYRGR